MIRLALALICVTGLAGCGADGAPEPVETGVRVEGTATIGVSGRF